MDKFTVMETKIYHLLGVMSGTSCDGIDLAQVSIWNQAGTWKYKLGIVDTIPYSDYWEKKLKQAHQLRSKDIDQLDEAYTLFLAEKIKGFILQNRLTSLDAVCSHGHTIFHQPDKEITVQIGNLPQLASLLKVKVVCDFRTQDVRLGGQGAPLVPVGDRLLFPKYRACINLGGFANISMEKEGSRIAYDICPVNTVLNFYAQQLGKAYDDQGKLAKSGKVNASLLEQLNALNFYKLDAPKSLGIEWVKAQIFPLLQTKKYDPYIILATFTEHISDQLAQSISGLSGKVLLTGGGTYNNFLIEGLKCKTDVNLILPDSKLINYKEALIFAFLGVLKIREEVNVLKSVTGAEKDHSSGVVYLPDQRYFRRAYDNSTLL